MANSGVFKGKVCVLLVGQARMDLGSFVKLETLSGGRALGFYATIILHVRRGQKADAPQYKYKDNDNKTQTITIGFDMCVKLEKTKISNTAIEGTEIHLPFFFGYGFNKPDEQQIKETFLKDLIEEERIFNELEEKKDINV
jgi:RecA/RadA recombinase